MTKRLLAFICGLFLLANAAVGATLLPPGEMTFLDNNGLPLSGGQVFFYIPNTSTPKDTYQNSGQSVLNTNPVILDSSGRAIIYGAGTYREKVEDANGNLIWDQLTADTSANNFSWAGTSGGTANAQTLTAPNFTNGDGQVIGFIAGLSNTGGLTLTVNGGSPIAVLKSTGSGPTSLIGGEVVAGNQYQVTYSASAGNFQLVSYPITPGFGQSINIASATSTDLGTILSHVANVTGTTTINSFGASAVTSQPLYVLTFAGSLTLTYNATSFILPSGQNIQTAAGDSLTAEYLGSGNWRVLNYSGAGLIPAPTYQILTIGTSYVSSPGCLRIEGEEVGGGGGSGGVGTSGQTSGGAGGATTFNGISANGGNFGHNGLAVAGPGGLGGLTSGNGSGTAVDRIQGLGGQDGGGWSNVGGVNEQPLVGSMGGGGGPGSTFGSAPTTPSTPGIGAGGAPGEPGTSGFTGSGAGGEGETVFFALPCGSYTYSIGAGGSAGGVGTGGLAGAAGAAGRAKIKEFYF